MEKRGKVRLSIGIIILLFIIFSFYFTSVSGNNSWVIEGDKVYVDNSNVYISAEPHTINENGYVYLNLNSKVYSGNIDLVLGFDTTKVHPANAELYNPEWIEQTGSYTCNFNNSYFNYTLSPKHFWCFINKTASGNGTGLSLVYERDFEWVAEKIAYWNESYLQEWKDISGTWNEEGYDYEGMNKWYYKKNIPVTANKNYQFRVFINIERKNGFSPASIDTKYWLAIKPSSETLQQAIANAHFYALDPWINSSGDNQNKNYLTTGLVNYYPMENNSEIISGVNNLVPGKGQFDFLPGLIGNAANCSGYSMNISNTVDDDLWNFIAAEVTINFWIKEISNSGSGHSGYLNKYLGDPHWLFASHSSGVVYGLGFTDAPRPALNTWTMWTIIQNNTGGFLIRNGTLAKNGTILQGDAKDVIICDRPDISNSEMKGQFDELGVWNRSLNSTEILDLYNNGLGIAYLPNTAPETSTPVIAPSNPTTNDNLNCNATLTDEEQESLIAYWAWYKDTALVLSGTKTEIPSGTSILITTLSSGNTTKGENWTCGIIPYDGYENGTSKNSSSVTILNVPPSIPVQLAPANNSGFAMYSTLTFIWNNSYDKDPTITYDLEIYNESDMNISHLIHSNTSITEGSENTSISIKLSDYTTKDDDYYWRIRANDSENYSNWSTIRHFQYANWTITFNLTDSVTEKQIDTTGPQIDFDISCTSGFGVTDVDNPYTATDKFSPGTWECNFSNLINYYNGEQTFIADSNKIIKVPISYGNTLTNEEHDWLEWLYNCWHNGNCWNLLANINSTAIDIWKRLTGTDTSVITQEQVLSYTLNNTSNITINYTINVPYKSEVAINELLPIRIYFWFTDTNRTTCYSQDKSADINRAEAPYCLPLVAETLGPNNGSITFTVDLSPSLPSGTYNFTRSVEIDPIGVWTNYGLEDLGSVEVQEDNGNPNISLTETSKSFFKKIGITGAIIGTVQALLSGWQLVVAIAIIAVFKL